MIFKRILLSASSIMCHDFVGDENKKKGKVVPMGFWCRIRAVCDDCFRITIND